jgi:hypothetical protein
MLELVVLFLVQEFTKTKIRLFIDQVKSINILNNNKKKKKKKKKKTKKKKTY